MIRDDIEHALRTALSALGAGEVSYVVERPAAMEHGDYASNVALSAAKILKKKPLDVAVSLKQSLDGKIPGVEKVEIAGAGFLNFYLSSAALQEVVGEAVKDSWGRGDLYSDKTILVEYTSPNLFKPLHIGNLVGNIVGESIARLLENSGAHVKRLNYPSDIGLTVAKGVWGLTKTGGDARDIQALGDAYRAGNEAYEDGSAKTEIETINKALYEDSIPAWSALRTQGIETSRRHLDALCRKLGTTFDAVFFESEAGPLGREIVRAHVGDVFEESEGAVIYRGAHTRVFLNSQGLPTYEAKEVGLFSLKHSVFPTFDVSITVTGSEQREFFSVVFDAISKLFSADLVGKHLRHVATGFLRLTTGKMSSRQGNVITGESLLEEVTKAARGREDVAVGALKYTVLRSGNGKDIIFDPDTSLSLEGDSGPYVQYALVRARSLLAKAEKATRIDNSAKDAAAFVEFKNAAGLMRLLVHFPHTLARAGEEMEPHHVVTYVTELASAFNAWYATERVIVDGAVADYTIRLVTAVERTLTTGLSVLGIPTPKEM